MNLQKDDASISGCILSSFTRQYSGEGCHDLFRLFVFSKWLGKTGNDILVRLMGLILMAIA